MADDENLRERATLRENFDTAEIGMEKKRRCRRVALAAAPIGVVILGQSRPVADSSAGPLRGAGGGVGVCAEQWADVRVAVRLCRHEALTCAILTVLA